MAADGVETQGARAAVRATHIQPTSEESLKRMSARPDGRPRRNDYGITLRPQANELPSQPPFSWSTLTPWPEEWITQLSPR